ncbi:glycerate kinase type-2 family protein [Polycladidibacter hongkongensis]|uniref:glycerate kinase type-2 family protein n=1 Tax=Polycladidibacter hongkongensis TaxID=1647556 RepID=UPI000836F62C|nr:glycerate kinase [Pseudovibrio hongkongensis]
MITKPRHFLEDVFAHAIAAAQPSKRLPAFLPEPPENGRTLVFGAGKAAAAMAQTLETHWNGPLSGLVVTSYGSRSPCQHIQVEEAGHPIPDEAGARAATRMLELVQGLSDQDLVISLISGGGSALLPLPQYGLSLQEKQRISKDLLKSGARIGEINCVRKHLSRIKGGQLAAACAPARLVNLMISDVPGDAVSDIASGPTVGDPTTCRDALQIIDRYGISIGSPWREALRKGQFETVSPNDPRLARVTSHLIATPQQALEAAAAYAESQGVATYILSDAVEGEARDVGQVHAAIARQVAKHGQPFAPPCLILSGGETTVTVSGKGRGGRNVEFLLSCLQALGGMEGVYGLAADTDGIDGREAVAGAVFGPDTLARAFSRGLLPQAALDNNDAHHFFEVLNDQVITGATHTNVNDFRALLVLERL